ncbi:MAG: copper chaperone PCu(A)C, partial [Stellaceae bacterium]
MTHRFPSLRGRAARPVLSAALILSLGAALGTFAATATAHAAEGGLTISDPWMRTIIPSRPAAGYFTLSNKTAKTEALVGASSPACGSVMLHQSMSMNGMDKMVMVKSVGVPAGG